MNRFLRSLLNRKVFANTFMVMFLLGGMISAMFIRQELLPDQEAHKVEIAVEMHGASPAEINTSILVVLENAVGGIDSIKRVDAEAQEGIGLVTITFLENTDPQQILGDIKSAVDRNLKTGLVRHRSNPGLMEAPLSKSMFSRSEMKHRFLLIKRSGRISTTMRRSPP